jgi:hypothetical protein
MEVKNIEKFFLNALLRISIVGVSLVLVSNLLLFQEDILSISISAIILSACVLSYVIREKYPMLAVLNLTSFVLLAMVYQRLQSPSTTTSLTIVLVAGFIISVMLKGRALWIMHGIAFAILNTIFVLNVTGPVAAAVTYSTLYLILTYATGVLKFNYDKINQDLRDANVELQEKSYEIAAQNEELVQIQNNLSEINMDLEKTVNERTAKIQIQNEILIKYSYTNAHHLRGPVARLLGLVSIYKLERNPDHDFIINKMADQAIELDAVIKKINIELESNEVEIEKT